MIIFIILTALTVSIDSFVCGFSLSFSCKKKIGVIFCIALTVFVMCLITNYLSFPLREILSQEVANFGGVILIAIGIVNLINAKKYHTRRFNNKTSLKQNVIAGFAVGLDGAFANLSLALMGINFFYVPILIAFFHALMIWFGILIANTSLAQKLGKIEIVPPIILILLGAYKLLGLFI